jgi:ATP-dependent Clp protease adapter protein ClpS
MEQILNESNTITILGKPYNVILFNDDDHEMTQVITQIRKATGCDQNKAISIMLEAHATGKAIVYTGGKERCEHVESILAEIKLRTKIELA